MMRFMKNRRKGSKKSAEKSKSGSEKRSENDEGEKVILTSVKAKDPEYGASEYPEPNIKQNGIVPTADTSQPEEPHPPPPGQVSPGEREDAEHLDRDGIEEQVASEPHYAHPDIDGDLLEDQDSVVTVIEKKAVPETDTDTDTPIYATVKKLTPPISVKAQQLDDRYTPDKEYREDPHQETRALLEAMSGTDEEGREDEDEGPPAKVDDYYIYVSEETLKNGPNTNGCVAMTTFAPPEEEAGAVGGHPEGHRWMQGQNGQMWHQPSEDRTPDGQMSERDRYNPRIMDRYPQREMERYQEEPKPNYNTADRKINKPEIEHPYPEQRRDAASGGYPIQDGHAPPDRQYSYHPETTRGPGEDGVRRHSPEVRYREPDEHYQSLNRKRPVDDVYRRPSPESEQLGAGYHPESVQPGAGYHPESVQPGAGYHPESVQPGAGYHPESVQPGAGYHPESVQPGAGYHPESVQPGAGYHPESVQPGAGYHPESVQPGAGYHPHPEVQEPHVQFIDPRYDPRYEDPRNRAEDPRNRADDPRNRADDPRNRGEDPRNRAEDPRNRADDLRAIQRQVSAPVHPEYRDPTPEATHEQIQRQQSSPHNYDPKGGRNYDYDPRRDPVYSSERDFTGPAHMHGYESDRSDNYDNYTRSYSRRKRPRDELVLHRSPSGGYIERTKSMPLIRNDPYRYGYPGYYGYPDGPRGPRRMDYDGYRERHRYPRHGQRRERAHRELRPPPVNHPGYPLRNRNHYTDSDDPAVNIPTNKMPNGHLVEPSKTEQEKARASPSESASSSSVSQKSGKHQKVSFREKVGKGNGEVTFPKVIEVDVEDGSGKALLGGETEGGEGSVGSDTKTQVEEDQKPRRLLIRRSVAIWFAWLCMGFYTEVVGPNIPYLQSRINGTHSDIAISLGSRGVGLVLGTSVGGLLCEMAPNWLDLWISTSLILGSLCASAVPWSMKLVHLCLTLGLSGFSKGFLQVATVTLAFRLWASQSVIYIIFLIHMAYAMGAAPCGQLAYLFDTGVLEKLLLGANETLSSSSPEKAHTNGGHLIMADAVYDEPSQTNNEKILDLLDYIPRPMYPFDIAAVLTFICGAVFLVFFGSSIRSVPAQSEQTKQEEDKEVELEEKMFGLKPRRWFIEGRCGFRAVLFIFVFFILPMAILAIFGSFHHLYILHNISKELKTEAMVIQTLFWAAVAVGRLVALVSARCYAPNGLTITCLTVSIVSTALMWVYGEKFRIFIWIFTVLLGFATGPLLPAGLTLCNLCISPTALGVAVAFLCQALGDGIFSWSAGFLLHHHAPVGLMYAGLASVGVSFLLYLPIIPVLAKLNQKKNTVKNGKIPNGKVDG